MRTGPFSSDQVISRLNAKFVPVYAVNEDYRDSARTPAVVGKAEQAEYSRVFREAGKKGFSVGTVHVYVLDAAGEVVGTRHVAEAAKTKVLVAFLDEMTAKLGTQAGPTATASRPQSVAPKVAAGGLALHLTARRIGESGSWDGTGENWVTFTPAEARSWLPADLRVARPVPLDPALTARLLRYVYPVSENNDPAKNAILAAGLTARRLSSTRVRLDGHLTMRHDFYHKPDGKVVRTAMVGYADIESTTGEVTGVKLVTDGATYNGGRFAVVVESE